MSKSAERKSLLSHNRSAGRCEYSLWSSQSPCWGESTWAVSPRWKKKRNGKHKTHPETTMLCCGSAGASCPSQTLKWHLQPELLNRTSATQPRVSSGAGTELQPQEMHQDWLKITCTCLIRNPLCAKPGGLSTVTEGSGFSFHRGSFVAGACFILWNHTPEWFCPALQSADNCYSAGVCFL